MQLEFELEKIGTNSFGNTVYNVKRKALKVGLLIIDRNYQEAIERKIITIS